MGGNHLNRRRLTLLVICFGLVIAASAAAGGPSVPTDDAPPTDQIVLRLADGAALDLTALDQTAGVTLRRVRQLDDGSYVLKLPNRHALGLVRAITNRLASRDDVDLAEPDAIALPLIVPSDTRWAEQWDLLAPSSGNYGANLPDAWDVTTGSATLTVGVIDTGYRPHADLAGRFVSGYDFIGDTLVANDGNGRDSDASDPGDWITGAENASGYFMGCGARNSSWHGTHVSGTIGAASNNALGVAGINWVSKIQPLRVLGKCGGYVTDIADAIRWAAGLSVSGLPANPTPDAVVNLSLGGSGSCGATYQSAIDAAVAAGTVVVVAAGNSNADASNFAPANCNNVITVAATGHTGSRAYYSNYGSTVEIAAPGGDSLLGKTILSTLNSGTTTPVASPAGDTYVNYQGTSMATPHVVGVVSLIKSVDPTLTSPQVLSILQSTATPFPAGSSCSTSTCGAGIVNAAAAVAAAGGGGSPVPPGAFGKTAPANLASVPGPSVTLQWETSSGAASYAYCIDTTNDSACSGSWVSAGTATSATVSGLSPSTTYYWQARASNATGDTFANGGAWWSFATQATSALPGAFSKLSPVNGQKNRSRPVALSWGASSGATSYEWCVSTTSGSCSAWTSTASTSASVGGLAARQQYFWQVRARNASGTVDADAGTWWNFRTR
jgi:serine protease